MKKRILKTDTLYTSIGNPIKNGMIAIDEDGVVLEIGTDLQSDEGEIEYFEGALCSGFVNAHCHLELSHLKGKVGSKTGITGFIKELQQVRNASEREKEAAIEAADLEMQKNGIVAVGDISNGNSTIPTKQKSSIHYHTFVELFGFKEELASSIFESGQNLKAEFKKNGLKASIVPHSPYTVSNKLFKLIEGEKNNTPLSIHNQESEAENQMFEEGEGLIVELMNYFGNEMIKRFKNTGVSSLQSVLTKISTTQNLLLVHNTFTSSEDIKIAESNYPNLFWCFCPKANLYIENSLPKIQNFINLKVKCVLGTDSLASNNSLSIWEEIQVIQKAFPKIELNELLKWATINGAEFLGLNQTIGSLEVGKSPGINWIKEGKVKVIS